MIPLRDNAAPRRLTPVNIALIAANIAVFIHEVTLGPRVAAFVERFALVPAAVTRALSTNALAWQGQGTHRDLAALSPLMTTVTPIFIHGGFWPVAANMLYLLTFRPPVLYR